MRRRRSALPRIGAAMLSGAIASSLVMLLPVGSGGFEQQAPRSVLALFDIHVPPPLPSPEKPAPRRPFEAEPRGSQPARRPLPGPIDPVLAVPEPVLQMPTPTPGPIRLPNQADMLNAVLSSRGSAGSGSGSGNAAGKGGGDDLTIATARWVRRPGRNELGPYQPSRAKTQHISGVATLICQVRLSRHVHDCRIEDEQPKGWGFGRATLLASHQFRVYPLVVDDTPVNDAWVRITIRWINW